MELEPMDGHAGMPHSLPEHDPFPASDFDGWAGGYDQDVTSDSFPFTGYPRVLAGVVQLADAKPGMAVLDIGAGTGNLSRLLAAGGCELWCTDFSGEMLERARTKLPSANFFQHDLRTPFPPCLQRRYDRIVSAYVFHHFELPVKLALVERLFRDHLGPGGRLLIADISFPTLEALEEVRRAAGKGWDEEPYWIAAEAIPLLRAIEPSAAYEQVSDCAGIYYLSKPGE